MTTFKLYARTVLASAIAFSLSACGLQELHDTHKGIQSVDNEATALLNQPKAAPRSSVEVVHGRFWVDPTAEVREAAIDPALRCKITFGTNEPATLDRLAQRITSVCGLGVRITSDAQAALNGTLDMMGNTNGGQQAAPNASLLPAGFTPPPLNGANNSYSGASQYGGGGTRSNRISLQFDNGELHNLLDAALGQVSLSYRFDPSKQLITVYYYDTRTFPIKALPTINALTNNIEAGSQATMGNQGSTSTGGGGGGGGGGQNGAGGTGTTSTSTTVKISNDVMSDLDRTLNLMCSHPKCAIISPSTSSVTVVDTPDVLARVATHMGFANKTMSRQTAVDIRILLYTDTSGMDIGANLDAAFKSAANKFGAVLAGAYQPNQNSGLLTATIPSGAGQWANSQAIINALNEHGKVSTVYTAKLTGTNLQPIPVQVFKNTGYVQSTPTLTVTNASAVSGPQTASVGTGFFMTLLPNISDDGKSVLLSFSQNLSLLDQIKSYGQAGTQFFTQSADTEGSGINQQVNVQTGATVVMTGFQADGLSLNTQTGIASGGVNTSNKRQTIIVLATPRILD
ncbi:PilN family type IVB pilus formation outer membrane protein (plasmid) [Dyella sp. BiH032]|uniref:PilN family type IVB pilus formation outer membrane protein n=1 Tax=Dyella sp. BiH032 TaxID=3075430 RepID=UPI002892FCB6|nr:PilN family type IVB pilus formation outer membrane protein [Dyella sp. BiH032]WNL48556.1 PilN family type IVB pilus formation outer membrane protein [Dyella sp. BiH032]